MEKIEITRNWERNLCQKQVKILGKYCGLCLEAICLGFENKDKG